MTAFLNAILYHPSSPFVSGYGNGRAGKGRAHLWGNLMEKISSKKNY